MSASPQARAALLLPAALFLLAYAFYSPDVVLVQADSEGYLNFTHSRSGGYPAFLAALRLFVRDVGDYAIAQRLLYALVVLVLSFELLRSFNSVAIALIAEVALLINPEVNRYHFVIVTESIFLSTLALFLAAALAYLRTGNLLWFVAASAVAGFAVAVRPTGIVLLPVLIVLVLAGPRLPLRETAKAVLVAAIPFAVMIGLESLYYRAHHTGARISLAPIHLLAKAGMLDVANADAIVSATPAEAQPLQRALEVSLAPMRRLVAEAPNRGARCKLIPNYEVFAQYQFAPQERALAIGDGDVNRLSGVALARIKHAVGGYLRLTSDHLQCLWTLTAITNPEQAELTAYLESRRPIPFEETIVGALAGARSPPFGGVVRVVMYGVAALLLGASVLLIATLARRRRPSFDLALAGIAGLIVHGSMLFTALTAVGIPRYVLGLWVPIAIGTGMSVMALARAIARQRSRPAFTS